MRFDVVDSRYGVVGTRRTKEKAIRRARATKITLVGKPRRNDPVYDEVERSRSG